MNDKTRSDSLSMTLPDGRQLGFAEFGSPDGTPILYFPRAVTQYQAQ